MEELNNVLLSEVDGFRELGHKFLAGEVSKMDFKGASGGMGVYAHRSGKEFMIRFRIPSGIASKEHLNLVYNFANRCKLEKIHLTTRQAIQLHGITIDEACDIMKEGIEKGIYSRGAGGNFPRNVAISPLSGVEEGEAFDVSPYALKVGEYFLNRIYTYKFPRKLKVAFSSNNKDEAHVKAVDLGFLAVLENGEKYFRVYIGGGLGRNSKLAVEVPELARPEDILYHIEAMTQLFIAEGDYENKNKARIRYILERMGKEDFIRCYKKHLEKVKGEGLKVQAEEIAYNKAGRITNIKNERLVSQKQEGLYSVYVHPVGGQLKLSDLKLIMEKLENLEEAELRLAMTEGFYIRNLNGKEAEEMLELTKDMGGTTRLEHSIACIGVPTCQIGVLNSQELLQNIIAYFKANNFKEDVLPQVHISGCPNSCSAHEIGEIGFCGKKKRVDGQILNVFELHLGGNLEVTKTRLAEYTTDIKEEDIPEFLYELALKVRDKKIEFYDWIEENKEDLKEIIKKYEV